MFASVEPGGKRNGWAEWVWKCSQAQPTLPPVDAATTLSHQPSRGFTMAFGDFFFPLFPALTLTPLTDPCSKAVSVHVYFSQRTR